MLPAFALTYGPDGLFLQKQQGAYQPFDLFGSANVWTAPQTITGATSYLGIESNLASAPSAPAAGFRQFADSTGRLAWIGSNGFVRTFDMSAITASRTYIFPNASTTMAGLSVAQTWTAIQTFERSTSGAAIQVSRTVDSVDAEIRWFTAGTAMWYLRLTNANTGANVGSDLQIIRRDDTGAIIGIAAVFTRSTGLVSFPIAIVSGGTARIGSESGRFAGGTIATPTSTDVVMGGGALAAGAGITSISGTAGIGYATGAGGTVTQITSRTTGVTLNKITGAITLVSAAGSTTWQSFTVTNSAVAATDTVIVNQVSGTDLNMIHVTNIAAGSFRISFATTGGTTTEQPVFRFTVLKSVSA